MSKVGATPSNTTILGHSMGALIGMQWGIKNKYKYFILSAFPLKNQLSALVETLPLFWKELFLEKFLHLTKFLKNGIQHLSQIQLNLTG